VAGCACPNASLTRRSARGSTSAARETIIGFEQGIDFAGNDVRRFQGVLSESDCQKRAALPSTVPSSLPTLGSDILDRQD
jgi:hypothetical protein